MEVSEEAESAPQQEKSARTAAQRRAEIRRRKLLMNSEDRMNKIVGFSKNEADGGADRCESHWDSSWWFTPLISVSSSRSDCDSQTSVLSCDSYVQWSTVTHQTLHSLHTRNTVMLLFHISQCSKLFNARWRYFEWQILVFWSPHLTNCKAVKQKYSYTITHVHAQVRM